MRLRAWLAGFQWLHAMARRGELSGAEAQAYREGCEDLAAMLVAAQRLTLNPGQTARGALRAVRMLPLELHLPTGTVRAESLDLSTGGFSSILNRALQPGEEVGFTLQLPDGPLHGRARVTAIGQQDESIRGSFKVEGLSPADVQRLEREVLETAMQQIAQIIDHT